ncbi:PREDICTED: 60S acidic ribosomal protein P1-like [Priapulus caudatus]|uniref:Large ribosomal subunit protein P1 n=1 Tax=Priapulus caudatus TaxID=37621 RepID=A0ABM1DVJ9_PRICU|nr:PREDICTED: 60S acidic ribosomal protein P1-like [Priapulus caudatus]
MASPTLGQDDLACIYAALILVDDDVAITGEKINTVLKAANVEIEPFWPSLYAKSMEDVDVKKLITAIGSAPAPGGGGPVGGGAPDAKADGAAPADAEKKPEKVESEESDDDMGFGLFD